MGSSNRATLPRRRLGRHLRHLRQQIGWTQEEVARKMYYSDSKISRFESGQLPDRHVLTAMLDLYGLTVSEWAPVLDEWERARKPGWWTVYKLDDQGYVSMEHEAQSIRESQPSFIPGLLQNEAYARAAFAQSATQHSDQWINTQIAVRSRRQERLAGDQPLVYEVIIQEGALRRHDVEPAIHRVQLHHIIEQASKPNITMRVMLEATGTHDGLHISLILLQFPDAEDRDIAYSEHSLGPSYTDDPNRVNVARARINHLARLALDPAESITFIEQLVDNS
jgi:transcriptional regulator with XRE-family HTH domain